MASIKRFLNIGLIFKTFSSFLFESFCNILMYDFVSDVWGKHFYSRVAHDDGNEQSDTELALLAKKDLKYFTQLYDKFFDKIYQFFYFKIRDRNEAEDLTAETFEKALSNIHSFEDRGLPFSAWIFRIANNLFIDSVRKKKLPTESLEDMLPGTEPYTDFDIDEIDRDMARKFLWEEIKKLPEKHQAVWALKLTDDLSHKEIAENLNMTEGNVNVIIHRSTEFLKQKLIDTAQK